MNALPLDSEDGPGTSLPSTVGQVTILIAEDEPTMSSILSHYLESLGHRVLLAKDGSEATEIAFRSKPDLILMDVHMPIMGGLEATRLLRASTAYPEVSHVPIICLTGLNTQADKDQCLAAGASGWLIKPFRIAELNLILRDFLPPTSKSVEA